MHKYNHDCPFEAFITNLGKYNEADLVGEWVKFPTTSEYLQDVFKRIGIGSSDEFGQPYEEWFISDYDIYVEEISECLKENSSIKCLNLLAEQLEALNDEQYILFCAACEFECPTTICELLAIAENIEAYLLNDGIRSPNDLGRNIIKEVNYRYKDNILETILNYVDYEKIGMLFSSGGFTKYGYIEKT